jgi:hypothetical protein
MAQTKKKSTAVLKAAPPAFPGPTRVDAEGSLLKDANGKIRADLSISGTQPSPRLRDVASCRSGIGAQPDCWKAHY